MIDKNNKTSVHMERETPHKIFIRIRTDKIFISINSATSVLRIIFCFFLQTDKIRSIYS